MPVGAKKKKKKRSKGKGGAGNGADPPLGDEELDYSRRAYDDGGELTDDDNLPDLIDIHPPREHPESANAAIPMTANSSTSSKTPTGGSKSKKKKKKNKGGVNTGASGENGIDDHGASGGEYGTQKIWNTTTSEEKERIKEFWLGLSEQERRNLVRIEKEHVSKRVKEGSKILNCSCHVCGRKQYNLSGKDPLMDRVAIEEELDVLYDAYYEELENYASPHAIQFGPEPPPHMYEDEEDDEEYDDDDDYDDSQDGEEYQHHHHHHLRHLYGCRHL